MQLSKYTISVGFNFPKSEIRKIDFQLKALEKRFQAFGKNMATSFAKTLTLPELKVKKLTLDSLGAQRTLQTDLNRIGRLLQVPIGNVQLDQSRINRQLQNVLTRASSAARLNVKTIAGTSGGANIHYPSHLGVPRGFDAFSGGLGGAGLGGFLPRVGPVGMGAAGVAAAGIYGGQKISELKQSQTSVEAQRVKLDVASGYKARPDIDRQNAAFFDLANATGSDANTLVDSYAQMMKTLQAIGLKSDSAFDLYKDMSLFAKGTGADSQQMSRAAYAIGQIYGKGFVSREELQLQLADALPSFRRYLMDVYAKETGNSSFESFDKALTDKQITTRMLEQAFREAAKAAMPNVQQYADTAQGLENQYANQRLQEQMRRTVDGEMIPAAKEYTQSLVELHKASEPLRNTFYSVAASATNLAASLISWGAGITQSPAATGKASNEQRSEHPLASSSSRGMFSVPDIRKLNDAPTFPQFVSPLIPHTKDWETEAKKYSGPALDALKGNTNTSVTSQVTFAPGSIVLNDTAISDPEAFVRSVEYPLIELQKRVMNDLFRETATNFPESTY